MVNKFQFVTEEGNGISKKSTPNYNLKKKKELLLELEKAHYTIAKLRLENIENEKELGMLRKLVEDHLE
jgi:hypothetical protein